MMVGGRYDPAILDIIISMSCDTVSKAAVSVEDTERVRVVCYAIPTALDCTGDLVAGEQIHFL